MHTVSSDDTRMPAIARFDAETSRPETIAITVVILPEANSSNMEFLGLVKKRETLRSMEQEHLEVSASGMHQVVVAPSAIAFT